MPNPPSQNRHSSRALLAVSAIIAIASAAALISASRIGGVQGLSTSKPSASGIVCDGTTDTTSSFQTAVARGGIVNVPSGVCVIHDHIPVRVDGTTINGSGSTATFIVQHGSANIFQVTASNVTIENVNVNTAKFNPGEPPVKKSPVPATIFATGNNETLLNVTSEAGTGFGMRFTGPSPCSSYGVHGLSITNVDTTNTGTGGFTALDVDCHNGATLANITVHGDYIALFQNINVTVINEDFTSGPFANKCAPDIYVTGPSTNIDIRDVTSFGGRHIFKSGTLSNVTIQGEVITKAGC